MDDGVQAVRRHYRAVVVSPHLDDAVFSCGGAMQQWLTEGPVLVLNLFTGYQADLKIHGAVLGPERLQEEAEAAKFLGFESQNLGELDAPFRRAAYRQLGNLFRPPVAQDINWLPTLRGRVLGVLSKLEFDALYVPLAVGWHVDHVLTHKVFDDCSYGDKLFYYEDAPYCCIPHATRYRLDGVAKYPRQAEDLSLAPTNMVRAWWQAFRAYAGTALMRNLQPWVLRQVAIPAVGFYLWRLMARYRQMGSAIRARTLRPVLISVTENFDQKIVAMMRYRSQYGEFFSSRQDGSATLSSYCRSMGRADSVVERYWRDML